MKERYEREDSLFGLCAAQHYRAAAFSMSSFEMCTTLLIKRHVIIYTLLIERLNRYFLIVTT